MRQKKVELPGWCQILDALISQIAKESNNDQGKVIPTSLREIRRDDKGGVDASLQAITSAPTTAVKHPEQGGIHND